MKPEPGLPASQIVKKRRRYSKEFKREAVNASLAPGVSVAGIALQHRLNANILFKWRRQFLRELAGRKGKAASMLPVMIANGDDNGLPAVAHDERAASKRTRGEALWECIEIEWCEAHVRLKGATHVESLRAVLEVLAQR